MTIAAPIRSVGAQVRRCALDRRARGMGESVVAALSLVSCGAGVAKAAPTERYCRLDVSDGDDRTVLLDCTSCRRRLCGEDGRAR